MVTRAWLNATPDAAKALQSLQWRDPQGPWLLGASDRENKVWQWASFEPRQADECAKWIQSREAEGCNIYQSLNRVRVGLSKKATKADITAALAVFADIDVPSKPDSWTGAAEEWALVAQDTLWSVLTERWPSEFLRPTVLMFSGGGFQLMWEVATPYEADDRTELFERMTLYVQERLTHLGVTPDRTQNIDRLHRLNRTTNRPKAKKQAKGQTDSVANVVRTDRKYSIEELRAAFDHPVSKPERASAAGPIEPATVCDDDLAAWGVNDALLWIIQHGTGGFGAAKLKDNSRSAWEWDAVCRMIRVGLDDSQVAGVLLNTAWKIGERARERRNPIDHIARLVTRARQHTALAEKAFACGDDGRPRKCRYNYLVAVHKLGLRLAYNEFADNLSVSGMDGIGPGLDEKSVGRVRFAIDDRFGFLPDKELLDDVLTDECVRNRFHPVRDHLDRLRWDGTPRLDTWLSAYCRAEDTPYTRAVGRVVLIAAVRRALKPGAKFDCMLILEGDQGAYKSTAVRVLAGSDDWTTDTVPIGAEGNKVIEHTRGKWIIEVGELAGFSDAKTEKLKAFLSRVADRGRLAYERHPIDVPRAFIMIGTTNKSAYLNDSTGARRFLPVRVGVIDIQALARDRDQILAEAVHCEALGESTVLPDSVAVDARRKQESRSVKDAWLSVLGPLAAGNEIWTGAAWTALDIPSRDRNGRLHERLGDCLQALGFEPDESGGVRLGDHRGRRWIRRANPDT